MSEAISECDVPPAKRIKVETVMDCNTMDDDKEADVTEEAIGKKQADTSEDPKHTNFVTPEELEKLKEFKVLDEVRSNDEDSNDDSDSSDGKSEVPEEEIEKMLEADLPDGFKGVPQPKQKPYVTIQKIVLEEKGVNHWEVLPLDWMVVRHYSGMPVYIHRTTRVCTLSKPYFLGKGNTRRHDIPISAIPCLAYRRALEEERKQQQIDRKIEEQIKNGTWGKNITNQKPTENCAASKNNGTSKKDDETEATLSNDKSKDETSTNITNNVTAIPLVSNVDELKISNGEAENTIIIDEFEAKSSHHNESKLDDDTITESSEVIELNNDKEDTKATPKCPFLNSNNVKNAEKKTEGICPVTGKSAEDVEMVDLSNDKDAESSKRMQKCDKDAESTKRMQESDEDAESTKCMQESDKDAESTKCMQESDKDAESTKLMQEVDKVAVSNELEGNVESNSDGNNIGDKSYDDIEIPKYRQPVVLPGGAVMAAPKVETINNSWKTQHLSHEQVNDYCKKLFKFKIVNIMHFNSWADRRKYNKARKTLQYPTLPDGTKLITIPARPNGQDNGGKPAKRDWVMNMDGRSYLSVFHEYVRRALQEQPVYEFVQLENAATPYQATVYIGGMQYGVGHGSSKRQAKSAAARASIHILIPEMKDELDAPANKEPDFSFFDYVGIEDPHISEFCAATCEPSPHAILRTCLLRNFGASDRHIQTEMKKLEFQKIELTMKVGKHSATVVCKNKKTAKQRASQAILQALHPHVRSWGSLLRLYGSRSVKSFKEKKLEEQQITLLQDRARHNQPNRAVLDKLRRDMLRLKERDASCVPIGTLLLHDDLPTHSGSNLNNVDL